MCIWTLYVCIYMYGYIHLHIYTNMHSNKDWMSAMLTGKGGREREGGRGIESERTGTGVTEKVHVCICVCVCVCVCVCEGERERCVCVCVCAREREKERQRETNTAWMSCMLKGKSTEIRVFMEGGGRAREKDIHTVFCVCKRGFFLLSFFHAHLACPHSLTRLHGTSRSRLRRPHEHARMQKTSMSLHLLLRLCN